MPDLGRTRRGRSHEDPINPRRGDGTSHTRQYGFRRSTSRLQCYNHPCDAVTGLQITMMQCRNVRCSRHGSTDSLATVT